MDKNAIKKYAVWARRELISRVSQKALQYGITESEIKDNDADSVNGRLLSADEKSQRAALIRQIKQNGFQEVIEEVAYTWFNRFCALRFMEVNGYLPSHIRVFSDESNCFNPQILDEAINIHLNGLDVNKVYKLKSDNKTEELYKYLIITQCNALNSVLPGMFQRIADYTELLFPDNILRDGSVVEQLVSQIPEDDWKDAVQIIGWLYQYYNIEPKDKVFEDLKKNIKISKDKIPAATQLFTPDWIVRYMVENSLGRLWAEGHPASQIKAEWKYYLDEAEQEQSVKDELEKIHEEYAKIEPKNIKCIDPCMGSGHILVYMFDILIQIYGEYGYSSRDAATMIVENNLFGLDIDDRAAQLAYFAVMMKARSYDRRFLERGVQPQIYSIKESNYLSSGAFDYIVGGNEAMRRELQKVVNTFRDAKEYGSIIDVPKIDFNLLYNRFDEIFDDISMFQSEALEGYLHLVKQAEVLYQKYDVVVTNPPYMGSSGMDGKLGDFVKNNYPDSKSDLFAVFIERCGEMLHANGLQAMITQHAWMFLSSFEKLRKKIIDTREIQSMLHLGAHAFEDIGGEVVQTASFVLRKAVLNGNGVYFRLVDSRNKEQDFLENKQMFGGGVYFIANALKFDCIPGSPIAYWVSEKLVASFNSLKLGEIAAIRQGLATGDNNEFLRLWFENKITDTCFTATDGINAFASGKKWFPCNKGGSYRKWYGNNVYTINWLQDGRAVKKYRGSVIRNSSYYFRQAGTWSTLSNEFSMRYCPKGFLFESKGSGCFANDDSNLPYIIGFLNSKPVKNILLVLSPTLDYHEGPLSRVPIIIDKDMKGRVDNLTLENILLAQKDWDSFETSWDFKKHPLI